jgi:hypothetical protein
MILALSHRKRPALRAVLDAQGSADLEAQISAGLFSSSLGNEMFRYDVLGFIGPTAGEGQKRTGAFQTAARSDPDLFNLQISGHVEFTPGGGLGLLAGYRFAYGSYKHSVLDAEAD